MAGVPSFINVLTRKIEMLSNAVDAGDATAADKAELHKLRQQYEEWRRKQATESKSTEGE